jgi:membrane protein required for beta-lactamase induction
MAPQLIKPNGLHDHILLSKPIHQRAVGFKVALVGAPDEVDVIAESSSACAWFRGCDRFHDRRLSDRARLSSSACAWFRGCDRFHDRRLSDRARLSSVAAMRFRSIASKFCNFANHGVKLTNKAVIDTYEVAAKRRRKTPNRARSVG